MEQRPNTLDAPMEKRAFPRNLVDRYYSVQFAADKEAPTYQFKLRDISQNGLCIAVRKDSALMAHLKVGGVHRMRYAPMQVPGQLKDILTEIRHITACREGPYKDHFLVGLAIVDADPPA